MLGYQQVPRRSPRFTIPKRHSMKRGKLESDSEYEETTGPDSSEDEKREESSRPIKKTKRCRLRVLDDDHEENDFAPELAYRHRFGIKSWHKMQHFPPPRKGAQTVQSYHLWLKEKKVYKDKVLHLPPWRQTGAPPRIYAISSTSVLRRMLHENEIRRQEAVEGTQRERI